MALTDALTIQLGKSELADAFGSFAESETFGIKACEGGYDSITVLALLIDAFEENTGNLTTEERNCLKYQIEKRYP